MTDDLALAVGRMGLAVLVLCASVACDREPQLARPTNVDSFGDLFFSERDNPLIAGLAPFERDSVNSSACGGSCNFLGCFTTPCTVPLQFQYGQRPNFSTPGQTRETSLQTYGGEWVPRLRASVPAFNYGMKRLSPTPFIVPEGALSIDTWVPDLRQEATPWILLPFGCDEHDSSFPLGLLSDSTDDPGCAVFRRRTMPFWASAVNLPRLGSGSSIVSIDYQIVRGGPLTSTVGPTRSTVVDLIDTIHYALRPGTPLLPVHIHVFAALDGTNNYTTIPSLASPSESRGLAEFLAGSFGDFRFVEFDDPAGVVANGIDWQSFQSVNLNNSLFSDPQANADRIFGRCGVGTRVESVNIIRQEEGMESEIDAAFECTERECGQDGGQHLDQDESGEFELIIGKYIQTAFLSLESPGAMLPQGIHVFFTGEIPNLGGLVVGCGCRSKNGGAGYAVVQGRGAETTPFLTTEHEIAHVLGIRHVSSESGDDEIDVFMDTFRDGEEFPASAEHEEFCERIRENALGAGFGG